MSSTGGGLHISRNSQQQAFSTDMKSVTITNSSSADLALTQGDIDAYAASYAPSPYTACSITITDTGVTLNAQS